jgi:hypothetical protein
MWLNRPHAGMAGNHADDDSYDVWNRMLSTLPWLYSTAVSMEVTRGEHDRPEHVGALTGKPAFNASASLPIPQCDSGQCRKTRLRIS